MCRVVGVQLYGHTSGTSLQVHCQACLAIRNLASDGKSVVYYCHDLILPLSPHSSFSVPPSFSSSLSLPLFPPSTPDDNQRLIVEYGGLHVLVPLLRSNDTETVTAAVAALRNLSIHNGNEVSVDSQEGGGEGALNGPVACTINILLAFLT